MSACQERHPYQGGILCTRDQDHKGGHLDNATGHYWPAAVARDAELSQLTAGARAAARISELADSIGRR